ncbi:Hypothetical protein mma_2529 [Janthinobacterium sp. Marseille]|nr:relaxase/mobilization nuclease domain-containing protein [Janthinobacterium sp. Marseille]ABR91885.1 Hypothetical protein mma_2529 [Janthinobacterium sp. Marseille]
MIIKLFSNSSSAVGAVNYVLSSKDYTGKNRNVEPVVLKGSAELTKEIDSIHCSKLTHKSISGVISFRENEDINEKQKTKLIEDFEKTFFGNMRSRTNAFYVEHRDKGNLEIHFVINRVDLESSKSFNPFPPGKLTQDFKDSFVALKNAEFGFKQIETNPLKTKYSANEWKALHLDKTGFKQLDKKYKLDLAVKDLVKKGIVKNRNELVDFLEKEMNFNVHRKGTDYISLKTEEGKNIRLSNGFYSLNDGKDYSLTDKEQKDKPVFNESKTLETFNRILNARNAYNEKRYAVKPTSKTPSFKSTQKEPKQPGPVPPTTQPPEPASSPSNQANGQVLPVGSRNSCNSTEDDKGRIANESNLGGSIDTTGAMSAQMNFDRAISALANAKTPQERAKAETQVAIARSALNRALAGIEENRKRQLNKKI